MAKTNAFYTNGGAGQGIQTGLDNLAALFAPQSGQNIYLAGKMQSERAARERADAARARIAARQASLSDYQEAGFANPTLADLYERASAAGGDLGAVDPQLAAVHGYGATRASQTQKEANEQLLKLYSPINANETRSLPPEAAKRHGLPQTEYGSSILSPGQRLVRGNGMTIEGPEKKDPPSLSEVEAALLRNMPLEQQQRYMLEHGRTSVNVNGEQPASEKAFGAAVGKHLADVAEAGAAAPNVLNDVYTMRDAIERGGDAITYGPAGELALQVKRGLGSFFGEDLPGVAPGDVINNVGFRLATAAAKAITSRPAQAEFLRALQAKPGLTQSREGALALLDLLEQDQKAKADLGVLIGDPANRAHWQETVNRYHAEHPVMSPFDKNRPLGPADMKLIEATPDAKAGGRLPAGGVSSAPAGAAPAASPAPTSGGLDPATVTLEQLQQLDPRSVPKELLQPLHDRFLQLTAQPPAAPPAAQPPAAPPAAQPSQTLAPAEAPALAAPPPQAPVTQQPAPAAPLAGQAAPQPPATEAPTQPPAEFAPIAPMPLPQGPSSMTTPFMQNLMRAMQINTGGG